MAARAIWKGFVRVSLVTFPVATYTATESARRKISLRQINRATGNRVKQVLTDSETGDPVSSEDIVKGYEYEKGKFIQIDPEELDELRQHRQLDEGDCWRSPGRTCRPTGARFRG